MLSFDCQLVLFTLGFWLPQSVQSLHYSLFFLSVSVFYYTPVSSPLDDLNLRKI
jgi:hypothetical protein